MEKSAYNSRGRINRAGALYETRALKKDGSFFCVNAGADDNGRRVDRIARRALFNLSLSAIYKAIRKGLIRLNGERVCFSRKALAGDVIMLHESLFDDIGRAEPFKENRASRALNENSADFSARLEPLTLFKNEYALALNKPAGIAVHAGTGVPACETLDFWVKKAYAASNAEKSLSFVPGALHRLDKSTSGLVVFSQNLEGARIFSRYMRGGRLEKYYLGVTRGKAPQGIWRDRLLKQDGAARACDNGKICETLAVPLAVSEANARRPFALTLAAFRIYTGRTHQIRAQCAIRGFPLWGDARYGERSRAGYFLHAWKMRFPADGGRDIFPQNITAPPPDEFYAAVEEQFGKKILVSMLNNNLYCELQ